MNGKLAAMSRRMDMEDIAVVARIANYRQGCEKSSLNLSSRIERELSRGAPLPDALKATALD